MPVVSTTPQPVATPRTADSTQTSFVRQLVSFLRFAVLSGLGWLLDFTILIGLVSALDVPPLAANVVSSCMAALSVFLLSRYLVFQRDETALGTRIAIYMAYTLCVIFVAALALGEIVGVLAQWPLTQHYSLTILAGIAKIIVTPPQLLLNFIVARATSERAVRPI